MRVPIRTERLDLVELSPAALQAITGRETARLSAELGVEVPESWYDIVPAEENLKLVHTNPNAGPWLSRGIVYRADARLVGEIGFHTPPDDLAVVEMGYEVLPEYQRRGIAREAILALTDWAHASGLAEIVYVTIAQDNAPSIALARSLGFRFDEHFRDPVDGPIVFYESRLPLAR
jgi:[ribosomal protein S5]-alanine N-acetyltransferase